MIKEIPHNFKVDSIQAPASKSYAQRAILAATLCQGTSTILNVGQSNDVNQIIEVSRHLGAEIRGDQNKLTVMGKKYPPKMTLNCGESGLGIRLTASVAAAIGGEFELIGSGSLLSRTMDGFIEFLPKLGVEFQSKGSFPPLHINGKLQGGIVQIDGSISSQYLSGLLMALPTAGQNSIIEVDELKSIPYVQMTLDLLKDFGVQVQHEEFKRFIIKGNQSYSPTTYTVEGDWSGAALWIIYGALNQKVTLKGLNKDSLQADRAILKVLELAGASFKWESNDLIVEPSALVPFEFDATHCPDLFPALVVLAAGIEGDSKIIGSDRLKNKESDRAIVLQEEFNKLGLKINLLNNEMIIQGKGKLLSGTLSSHNDHRIAMAGAIASILTPNGVMIKGADAVNKSYPSFWNDLGIN
ncbi:MAG: 3-phosphoshikimate 1-carboxyvinyltransferase [Crocinitomicaceae bacterium]